MEGQPEPKPMPKKFCVIALMFPIEQDAEALAVKEAIDKAIGDKQEKRFRFEITDNR